MVRGILLHIVYDIRNEMKRFSTKKEKKKTNKNETEKSSFDARANTLTPKKREEKRNNHKIWYSNDDESLNVSFNTNEEMR